MNHPTLAITHIIQHPERGPSLAGTRFSVAFLATFLNQPEWTVERIVENYPLTPAQIYAAWSYYYDHQAEIEAQFEALRQHPWRLAVEASTYFSPKA